MSLAFVFPGQGSQSVGMLAALAAAEPVGRGRPSTRPRRSSATTSGRCASRGPSRTSERPSARSPRCSPRASPPGAPGVPRRPACRSAMAGHSLGEYTALVCSDALDFRTAVDLVRFRGQVMQRAVPLGTARWRRSSGSTTTEVGAACREAAQRRGRRAGQFQRAGAGRHRRPRVGGARAIEAAKARGAKRAVALPVSVPSHSSLMVGAADELAARLAGIDIRMPNVPAVYTVDVKRHESPDGIRAALREQLFKPVRWADTVRAMLGRGCHDARRVRARQGAHLAQQADRATGGPEGCWRSTIRNHLATALAAAGE